MEASAAARIVAALAAFAAAYFAFGACAARARRARAGRLPDEASVRDGWTARVLRRGVPGCSGVVRALLSIGRVDRFARNGAAVAGAAGFASTPEAFLSVAFTVTAVCFVAGSLASASVGAGAAVAVCVAAIGSSWVRSRQEKRVERMREAVPDAIQSMLASFRSGLSLQQTLDHVAEESHGDLTGFFARASHLLRTGATSAEALACLRTARGVPELAFVSIALDVQHQAGGSMAHVLDAAREMAESELELARSMRVQTAQARLSARVVSVMPVVLVALFSVLDADYLAPFFASATGVALLSAAVLLQAAGVVAVRRTLRVGEG